jgi:hypothetical protein
MAQITIESESLKKILENCIELECRSNASTALAMFLRLAFPGSTFMLEYPDRMKEEMNRERALVAARYDAALQAIATGIHVDAALSELIESL